MNDNQNLKNNNNQSENKKELKKNFLNNKLKVFFPLFLIFTYLIVITLLNKFFYKWEWTQWSNQFMGGFFLIFSFFKFTSYCNFIKGFSSYDPIAKKSKIYAYFYPWIELILGILYISPLSRLIFLILNIFTACIMLLNLTGVIYNLINKRKYNCFCLNNFFGEIPLSIFTVFEYLLMFIMSLLMIFFFIFS
jgi:hypothetical protein